MRAGCGRFDEGSGGGQHRHAETVVELVQERQWESTGALGELTLVERGDLADVGDGVLAEPDDTLGEVHIAGRLPARCST